MDICGAKTQKLKSVVILFVLGFFVLVSCSFAGDKITAQQLGSSIGRQFHSKYGSSGGITLRAIKPLSSSAPMRTLNDNMSFSGQIQCPSSKAFLQILFEPTSTNDFTAVISQDPQLTGHFTYQATTPLISGVCSRGFISCDAGTWVNCRFYQWAITPDYKVQWREVADDTQLGSCFCVNNSCGGNIFQQFYQIANTFGAGLAAFIGEHQHFAISNVQSSFPTLTYYGQDARECTVMTGSYSGTPYNNPTQYYKNSAGLTNAVSTATANQLNNPDSPYYSAANSEYLKKNPMTQKQCEIKRRVYLSDPHWITDGGMRMDVSCLSVNKVGNNLYECWLPANVSQGCGVRYTYTVQGHFYIYLHVPDDANMKITINNSVINGCHLENYGETHQSVSCSVNDGITGGKDAATMYITGNSLDYTSGPAILNAYVTNNGACNGAGTGKFAVFLKRAEKISLTKTDTCENIDTTNCRLKDEEVCDSSGRNCVYLINNYQETGIALKKSCLSLHDSQTNLNWIVCADGNSISYETNSGIIPQGTLETGDDVWWTIKRVYQCKAPQMSLPSLQREENIEESMTYNSETGEANYPDTTTSAYGLGGYSGVYQAKWQYNGPQDECQFSCIVKEPAQRTVAVGGGSETTNNPAGTDSSYVKSYLVCRKDVNGSWYCPATGDQEVIQPCVCLDRGLQSAATMSALVSAAKDMICSQE